MMLREVVLYPGTYRHSQQGSEPRGQTPEVRPQTSFLANSQVALLLLAQGPHSENDGSRVSKAFTCVL